MGNVIGIKGKVLLLCDPSERLDSVERLLMIEGYDVVAASSLEIVSDLINKNRDIACIVARSGNSSESINKIFEGAKVELPFTSRILISEDPTVDGLIEAVNRGRIYRFIKEPFEEKELLSIIGEASDKYRLIIENRKLLDKIGMEAKGVKKEKFEIEKASKAQVEKIEGKNVELTRSFHQILEAFSTLLELHQRGEKHHGKNVAHVSSEMARSMGLSREEIETISIASLLHDIGKIGSPDMLVIKNPEMMGPEELENYRAHPLRGQAAIDSVEYLRNAGILIRHHHERFDGEGFPDMKKGGEIPLGARIMAYPDYADKIFRYHSGHEAIDYVLEEIQSNIGSYFDPALFPHFKGPFTKYYANIHPDKNTYKMEVQPDELSDGMVLAKNVVTGTGILVMGKGTELDPHKIEALKQRLALDPNKRGVFVWVRG